MLRFTTGFIKMRLLLLMIMMWAFMGMTAAQPPCDPLTQYEILGQCCKLCGPGTRMSSIGTCLEPQCEECLPTEYQDGYTKETKCKLQPYCDPNKNFNVNVHENKKKQRTCMCKLGFHCSSDSCITCVPHRTCTPGHGVQVKGDQMHDTVCQKCPKGTFSNETSWEGVCKKWTACEDGYYIQLNGTDISDNICEKTSRTHVLITCIFVGGVIIVIAAVLLCLCRGHTEGKIKGCYESCQKGKTEPRRETKVLIETPTDHIDEDSMLPETQPSQEGGDSRTPEENEDEPSQETSADVLFTDKGNYVTQENGKSEVLSRQESQTHTFTD